MQTFWADLLDGERYAILATCLAYVFVIGIMSIIGCLRIRRWPHTIGTLVEDGVSTSIGSPSERMSSARVRYKYSVADTDYTGKRLSPFVVAATGTKIAEWQKRGIQKLGGDLVTVFYNPARPEKSYLIRPSLTGISGVFLLFTTVAIALWFAF